MHPLTHLNFAPVYAHLMNIVSDVVKADAKLKTVCEVGMYKSESLATVSNLICHAHNEYKNDIKI